MKKFDTRVQKIKYEVLREVARHAWNNTLTEGIFDIPKTIIPNGEPTMRCCVYKERAIISERVKMAMGRRDEDKKVIQVIDIACDECPAAGYEVGDACRGCLAHRCEAACKFGAITFDDQLKAHIDKEKCKNCGACAKACPYSAIQNRQRPCMVACKTNAIGMAEDKSACIDYNKCISCGACVYMCPFGAITDRSYILDVIDMLKKKDETKNIAIVAPSISSQFSYAKIGQVVSGIKELGFDMVVEAALGADMVAIKEAKELAEKGFITSSCCPAFVQFIKNDFPTMEDKISHNYSPMAELAKYLKETKGECNVVFIGPCTAKKEEQKRGDVEKYVDCVLTFEELQSLIDSRDIVLEDLEEDVLDNASYFGRIFARSGGLSDAVAESIKEQGIDFEPNASVCDGIDECRMALLKASKGMDVGNFIEGMACVGGCIGGAGCLTHEAKDKALVDKYGKEAREKTILDALKDMNQL